MSSQEFTSNKPYLFRAILEWLLDNSATPYILVDAMRHGVEVPEEHIKDGQIVLNIKPSAVQNWEADNEAISFNARFGGVSRNIYVPLNALMAIYAQENGLGMVFPVEEESAEKDSAEDELAASTQDSLRIDEPPPSRRTSDKAKPKKGSHLKIVK